MNTHVRGNYYRIQKGDTIYAISKRYGVSTERLLALNAIKDPTDIKIGTLIYLPRSGPELPYVPKRTQKARKNPAQKSYAAHKNVHVPKNLEMAWPIKGSLITKFGRDGNHRYDGINIEGRWGEEIKAAHDGTVVYSGDGVKGYGNMVIIKHPSRIYSVYALNSENLVSKGDEVKKSQVIAKVGGIPRIGKSFLHFQVRSGKKAINPVEVLK